MIKKFLKRIKGNEYHVQVERMSTKEPEGKLSINLKKIINLLNYTKRSSVSYSAGSFDVGYHSFTIDEVELKGQRNPVERFANIPFDFTDKTVLDIGCNQGGMINAIANKISSGIGIDYDSRMINAANRMKFHLGNHHTNFFVFDLEKENLNYIKDFLPNNKVDAVFLLSVCMWVENWKEVIKLSKEISSHLIFESNGKPEQQNEQVDFLKTIYSQIDLINEKSEDDPSQKSRRLYLCK